jgi:hypothetical protein
MPGKIRTAHRGRLTVAALLLAVLAFSSAGRHSGAGEAILAGYGASRGPSPGGDAAPRAGRPAAVAFTIAGSTSGLFPGATLPLVLTVSNLQKVAITVTTITTTVGAASASCGASNVKVTSYTGKLFVTAGGKAKATVHVTMAHGAPGACQNKTFSFVYAGLATEA